MSLNHNDVPENDRRAIEDLLQSYCSTFDRGDWQGFEGLWHEEASWIPGEGHAAIKGAEAIARAAREMSALSWQNSNHQVDEHAFSLKTEMEAEGRIIAHCDGVTPDGSSIRVTLTYHDRYVCRDEAWLFLSREIRVESIEPSGAPKGKDA